MLKFLSVENLALIDQLQVDFSPGLTLITGETGSGKSILVDCLGLLIGQRASQESIRQGFERARVEGIFELSPHHPVRPLLLESGIEVDGPELVIRREISSAGANKVFINGSLSTQTFLLNIGLYLADIHGQHDQQSLLQPRTHLQYLDAWGGNQPLLESVAELHRRLLEVTARIDRIRRSEQERLRREDLLRFQLQDIEKLKLQPGIESELEEERRLLGSAERRLQSSQGAFRALYEDDLSVLNLLAQCRRELELLSELDKSLEETSSKILDIQYQLEEIAFSLRDYAHTVEANPQRLEWVEERLAEIQKARRKYGETVEAILDYHRSIGSELEQLHSQGEELGELIQDQERLSGRYLEEARRLSEKRRQDALGFCRAVEEVLVGLAMQKTVLTVALDSREELASEQGIDQAEFLISPNPGEAPRPLAKIASGGELSRVILALKSVLTLEHYAKTLVFDEVDSGIGGRVAGSLGEKLSRLGRRHQIFCVTHLAQIASHADHHFHVDKHLQGGRTVVQLRRLEENERVEELARMLAGDLVSETTRQQARELRQTAVRR